MSNKVEDNIPLPNLQPANLFDIPSVDPLAGLVQTFLSSSFNISSKFIFDDFNSDSNSWESAIAKFGEKGLWRGMVGYTKNQIIAAPPKELVYLIKLWCYRLIALMQLNLCQLAKAELDKLGDLFSPSYSYNSHTDLFPNQDGSFVPFQLFVIWAQLPGFVNDPMLSIDRAFYLANYCQTNIISDSKNCELWKIRLCHSKLIAINCLIGLKELGQASDLLLNLTHQFPNMDWLYLGLCRLHLHGGNLQGAELILNKFKGSLNELTLHKGLIAMAKGQWSEATDLIQPLITNDHLLLPISNDLAMCHLYLCNLPKAIQLLQSLTHSSNPNSTSITNLTTMYELATYKHLDKKRNLLDQLHPNLGDGFKISCFRLN